VDKPLVFHLLDFYLLKGFKQLVVTTSFQLDLVGDLDENCVYAGLDEVEGVVNLSLEFGEFLKQAGFGLFNRRLDIVGVDVHWGQLLQIALGLVDNYLQRLYLVVLV
jgi:hypothetical protein